MDKQRVDWHMTRTAFGYGEYDVPLPDSNLQRSGSRYDHAAVTTLLLVTTEETQLEHLVARKVA